MRIAILNATFPPESLVAGRMAFDLASYFVRSGHEVRVICPYPSRPMGATYAGFETSHSVSVNQLEGITVIRVPSFTAPQSRLISRMRESWSFGRWAAGRLGDPTWRPEVLYEDTWPLLAQMWISRKASQLAIPRVSQIMDLYPESALGRVPNWVATVLGQPLRHLDKANALRAEKVVVLSEQMRAFYERRRGIPREKLEIVHTWLDETPFLNLPRREQAGRHYDVRTDLFTFLYLGNIGAVAGVDHLISSFAEAKLGGARLLIIGEGSEKEACLKLASQTQAMVTFLSDHEASHVPLLQALADVCLLPVRRGAAFSSIPSKLSSYMLSGKPVLASVDNDSETARLVLTADCGWIVEPERTQTLARKMQEVRNLRDTELSAAGARGRAFALSHLSKSEGVRRLASIILQAARRNGQSRLRGEERADFEPPLREGALQQ